MEPLKGSKPPVEPLRIVARDAAVVIDTPTTFSGAGGTRPYTFDFAPAGNVSGGSIDKHGNYRAGLTTGTDTIQVADRDNNTAGTTVAVQPPLQVRVHANEVHKVVRTSGSPSPEHASSALEFTIATEVELVLEIVGGVADFTVNGTALGSGGTAVSPESGRTTFTYTAGPRQSTDSLTISDAQSTANTATVSIKVTEDFDDLFPAAASGDGRWACNAYLSVHGFIGGCLHDGILYPPAVPVEKLPCIDAFLLHTHGLQSLPSRGHDGDRGPVLGPGGLYLMGSGSDAGFFVPHVSIPPNNLLLLLVFVLGESRALFASSSVKLPCWSVFGGNDECGAACVPYTFPPWPGLNLACSDEIPLPTDFVIAPNTVQVGMNWKDLVSGLMDYALEVAFALVLSGLGGGKGKVAEKAAGKASKKPLKTLSTEAQEQAEARVKKELKEAAEKAKKAAEEAAKEAADAKKALKAAKKKGDRSRAMRKEVDYKKKLQEAQVDYRKKLREAKKAKTKQRAMEGSGPEWYRVGRLDDEAMVNYDIGPEELYERLSNRGAWREIGDALQGVVESELAELLLLKWLAAYEWEWIKYGLLDQEEPDEWDWLDLVPLGVGPLIGGEYESRDGERGWWGD